MTPQPHRKKYLDSSKLSHQFPPFRNDLFLLTIYFVKSNPPLVVLPLLTASSLASPHFFTCTNFFLQSASNWLLDYEKAETALSVAV